VTREKLLKRLSRVANFILGGGGVFCVLAWLYFAYNYWWAKTRLLTNPVGMATYYVLPAILAILLFASLRLKSAYKINVALSCLSLVAAIYAIEILLPTIGYTFGVELDTRTLLQTVIDLRKIGVDAVPAMAPMVIFPKEQDDGTRRSFININGAEVFPLAGVANKFTAFCNEAGEYTNYESDEHGFNNPSGIWKSNELDIAIVGDSFTHGWCVPTDTQFVSLIRKQYPSTLNLGMGGNGPLVELATLREFLPPLKPKIVLWVYFEGNDMSGLHEERKSPLLMRYLSNEFNQGLIPRQTEVDQALLQYVEESIKFKTRRSRQQRQDLVGNLLGIITLSNLRQKIGVVYGRPAIEIRRAERADLELLRDILSLAKAAVHQWGGVFYFVYLPSWERYGNPQPGLKDRALILNLVNTLQIPIIDMHPVFLAEADPLGLFPRRFGHYNEKGYRLVAETVLEAISSDWRIVRVDRRK
jgi:lysophospholipase L1-like esterase